MGWSHKAMSFICGCYEGIIGWAVKPTDPHNGLKIPSDKSLKDAADKTFTQTRIFPLKQVKELKNKLRSSSVNDIMMAVITIGIRKYLLHTNDPVLSKIDQGAGSLQGMIAINTRRMANPDQAITNLGNDFLAVSFVLPLQYSDEIDAVWKSKFIVDQWKISPQLFLQKEFSVWLLSKLPESALIDATFESTLGNHVIDDINFMASSGIGLYLGILSYNQKMRISIATDKLANIDTSLLVECMEKAYDELQCTITNKPDEFIEPPHMSLFSAKVVKYYLPVFIAIVAAALYCALFSDK